MRFQENPDIVVLAGNQPSWVWDSSSGFNVSSVCKAFVVLSSSVPRMCYPVVSLRPGSGRYYSSVPKVFGVLFRITSTYVCCADKARSPQTLQSCFLHSSLSMIYHLGGEGNGNPLQYSCLEISMVRGVHRVTKSRTRMSN